MTTSSHVRQFSTRHELGKYGIDWEHDEDRCFDESLGDCVDVFLYKVFFAINVGRYEREKCTEAGAGAGWCGPGPPAARNRKLVRRMEHLYLQCQQRLQAAARHGSYGALSWEQRAHTIQGVEFNL